MKTFLYRHQEELWRIVRFLCTGGLSFLIYTGFYLMQSRWLWVDGPRVGQNFIALVLSTFFNYYAHRQWTFRAERQTWAQFARYLVTVVTATLLQTFLFWIGHDVLRVYDLFVIIGVTGIIACYTYVTHRLFTFKTRA